MAHFAKIEDDGSVSEVIVVDNKDCGGGDFPDSEPIGQAFISTLGLDGEWLQTSYNRQFRGWFAAAGMTYRDDLDMFILQQPAPNWTLDEVTGQWVSPIGQRLPI